MLLLIEQHRRAQDDLAVANLNLSQPSGLKRARAGREFVLRDEGARVDGQVSQIARVPEDHRLHHAVVDVRLVDVRAATGRSR